MFLQHGDDSLGRAQLTRTPCRCTAQYDGPKRRAGRKERVGSRSLRAHYRQKGFNCTRTYRLDRDRNVAAAQLIQRTAC